MLLINFSHPITATQLARIADMVGQAPTLVEIPIAQQTIDRARPMAEVACAMVDSIGLTPEQWQVEPIIINPPALAPLALAVLAELHGRCGHFPAALNVRPVPDALTPTYEVFEVMRLQIARDRARTRR